MTEIFSSEFSTIKTNLNSARDILQEQLRKINVYQEALAPYTGDNMDKINLDITNLMNALENINNATLLTEKQIENNIKAIKTYMSKMAGSEGHSTSHETRNSIPGVAHVKITSIRLTSTGVSYKLQHYFVSDETGNTSYGRTDDCLITFEKILTNPPIKDLLSS